MANSTRQSVLFEGLFSKRVVATFDGEAQSSDAGLLLLAAADRRLGLTEALAACLADQRDQSRVEHTFLEMFRQRVFGIAAGYEDANDAARIGADPVLKEACGRRALEGAALASQPTLSRFERSIDPRALVRLSRRFEAFVIERHRERLGANVRRVTIDLDPMDDPTHGQQPFAFFNGHYDSWCYLPLFGFLTFNDESEQYLYSARLRPGNAKASRTAPQLLKRTVKQLRTSFPKAKIRVRLDGGFATPQVLDLLDELVDEYVVGVPGNARLEELAAPAMAAARDLSERWQESAQIFDQFQYAAKTWSHARRIVVKAEVVRLEGRKPEDNARFVAVKLPGHGAEASYDVYRGRGDVENRVKELCHGVRVDRTSCTTFLANHFRVLLASCAYSLFQELRLHDQQVDASRLQVETLRERFIKIGARVIESVRRIVLRFPAAYPWKESWRLLARQLGAT